MKCLHELSEFIISLALPRGTFLLEQDGEAFCRPGEIVEVLLLLALPPSLWEAYRQTSGLSFRLRMVRRYSINRWKQNPKNSWDANWVSGIPWVEKMLSSAMTVVPLVADLSGMTFGYFACESSTTRYVMPLIGPVECRWSRSHEAPIWSQGTGSC